MKRLSLATGLFLAMACSSLHAQSMNLRANIPFDFRVGDKLMPAGEYTINHLAEGVLAVRERSGAHAGAMLLTLPTSRKVAATKGGLEFNRYGDTYFLAKILTPDSQDGRALFKSTREKEVGSTAGSVRSASVALLRK